jgi:HD superfamily phosphohydrolase
MRRANEESSSNQNSNGSATFLVKTDEGEYSVEMKPKGGENTDEGVVFKATYQGAITSAFKAIKVDPGKEREIIGPLISEVKLLSLLRHSNLVGIIDYGDGRTQRRGEEKLPDTLTPKEKAIDERVFKDRFTYIAMNWIEGRTLDVELRKLHDELSKPAKRLKDENKNENSLQLLLKWLQQISDVMTYLHERGILHMDIKPENIMIESESENAVLIDLGNAVIADIDRFKKYFKVEGAGLRTDAEIRVLFTPKYAPNGIRGMNRKLLRREKIQKELFPRKDLYAFGRVIQEVREKICPKDAQNVRIRNSEIIKGLDEMANRLVKGYYENNPQCQEYVPAYYVRNDLCHSNPRNLYPFDVPELSNQGDGKFIQLSEDYIWIPERLSHIIDHPFFQRLRNIIQLNYVHLIYPDAHHTRFSHCLCTYNLARRAISSLLSDVNFRINVDRCDIEGALLCALLHDIGHYPLSHMFEDIPRAKSPPADPIVSDEDLFRRMIDESDDSPVGQVIQGNSTKRGDDGSIADLIRDCYDKSTLKAMYDIWEIMRPEKEGPGKRVGQRTAKKPIHRVLAGLISSAIDIDKVAYLSIDSAMSGVNFGKGIDIHAYLSNLKMPAPRDLAKKQDEPLVAIGDKGFAAAESIILARYWMLSRVYWHHTNRKLMSAFKFLLQVLFEKGNLKFSEYFANVFWGCEKEATKYIISLYNKLPATDLERMVNPLEGMTQGIRPNYKRFFVIQSDSENGKEGSETYKRVYNYLTSGSGDEFQDLEQIREQITVYLNEKRKGNHSLQEISNLMFKESGDDLSLKQGCLLIDVPRKPRELLELGTIYVSSGDDSGKSRSLRDCSQLLRNFSKETLIRTKKCRIFIHPKLYTFLEENSWTEDVREVILKELKSLAGA